MKVFSNVVGLALQVVIFLLVVLAVLIPISPLYEPIPARDQGVYLYAGQQVLDGSIPYRDVWDHKGPLIYYINALGLLLTNSTWGIWFLEIIFLFFAAIFGFLAMRMVFDPAIAFSSTVLWLVSFPRVMDHGNSVEEFSLPFQFAAIYFYLRSEKSVKGYWNEFIAGVMAAMVFSLRPNNIGVNIAIGLVLLGIAIFSPKERSRTLKRIAAMALGGVLVLGVIGIYFAGQKSLGALLDAVFTYNYHYSKLETLSWETVTKGFDVLEFIIPLAAAGLAGLVIYLLGYWKSENKETEQINARFALFLLIAIPIQIYFSVLSGRKYLHYYIAWLPVLTLLVGFLIFLLSKLAGKIFPSSRYKNILNLLIAGGFFLVFGLKPVVNRIPRLTSLFNNILSEQSLPLPDYSTTAEGVYVEYILHHTQADDYVLIWGNASVYNFLTDRRSPSRFMYTYAFGVPNYVSQEMVDELQLDIIEKKPVIIDATMGDKNLGGIDSSVWKNTPVLGLIRFIEGNYVQVDTIGPDRFHIWVYKGE
jgi:hypothetical protein